MGIGINRQKLVKASPEELEEERKKRAAAHKLGNDMKKQKLDRILEELSESNMGTMDIGTGHHEMDIEKSLSKDSPIIIKGFSAILINAVERGATDIHIEPYENEIRVRYRIDGQLIEIKTLNKNIVNALVSRVKILSNLDIAERRLPQDGRMGFKVHNKEIDFRVAIMPTIYGEKVVIRILDKSSIEIKLDKLGFDEDDYEKILEAISKPHGIILVTGPTGSGKSTTLYGILNYHNRPEVNISTVEDPIEYNIYGINQVQAKPEIGLTFPVALRQFLRQDPDIIMVGEIRDEETAEIALKAALTGHLVFSTLHTNDAVGSIFRLKNMGLPPYLISAAFVMAISQRLIRKLCSHCKEIDESAYQTLIAMDENPDDWRGRKFYKGKENGCEYCNHTGYKGRMAVHEVFVADDEASTMIEEGVSLKSITDYAKSKGMVTLKRNGINKASHGKTSLSEVMRACN